jgi:iron complex transport system permease protein
MSILGLLLCFIGAIFIGPIPIPLDAWQESAILWDVRVPRALLSISVGASLGLAGAIAQAFFRNPLADPALLGVSSGAALAVALSIVTQTWLEMMLSDYFEVSTLHVWRSYAIPLAAFLGALTSCYILLFISRKISFASVANLLLCGIAFNAFSSALVGVCIYLSDDEQLRDFMFWTLGSVASADQQSLFWVGAVLIGVVALIYPLYQSINALSLGEDIAQHLGIDLKKLQVKMIVCIALLCGVSVACCGMIGFISLVAPQMVRMMVGSDQRHVLIFSMFLGGLLLLVADTLARTFALPAEMPVGIFTSLIGAPYFLYLVKKRASAFNE